MEIMIEYKVKPILGSQWQVFKNGECVYSGDLADCKAYISLDREGILEL